MTMNSKKIKNKKSDSPSETNFNIVNENKFDLSILKDKKINTKLTPIALPNLSKLNLEELADLADIDETLDEMDDQLDSDEDDNFFAINYDLSATNLSIDSVTKDSNAANANINQYDLSASDYDFDSSRNAQMLKNLSKLVELRSIYLVNNKNTDESIIKKQHLTNNINNNDIDNVVKKKTNISKSKIKDNNLLTPISQHNNSNITNKTSNATKVNLFQIMPNQCYIDFSDINNFENLTEDKNKKSSLSISTSSSSFEEISLSDSALKVVKKSKSVNLNKKASSKQHQKEKNHKFNDSIMNKKSIDRSLLVKSVSNDDLLSEDKILVNPNIFFYKIYSLIDSFNKLNYLNNNQFENGKKFESASKGLLEWLIKNNYNKVSTLQYEDLKSQKDELQSIATNSNEAKDLLSDANSSNLANLSAYNIDYLSSSLPSGFKLSYDLKQNLKSLSKKKENDLDEIGMNNENSKNDKFESLRNKYIESKRRNKLLMNKIKKFKKSLNKDFKVIPRNDYKALIIQLKRYQEDFTLESKEKCHLRVFYEEKIQLLESMLNEKNKPSPTVIPFSSSTPSSSIESSKSKILISLNSTNKLNEIK